MPEFERMATTFPRVGGMSSLFCEAALVRNFEDQDLSTAF